jgi:hypothetical protein
LLFRLSNKKRLYLIEPLLCYILYLDQLQDRLTGQPARRDYELNSKEFTKLEEEFIIEHIYDPESRGFGPTIGAVRETANKLLAERDGGQVGQN